MQDRQERNEFKEKESKEVETSFPELKLVETKLMIDEGKHAEEELSNVKRRGQQSIDDLFGELQESINSLDEYGFEWQPAVTFEKPSLKEFDVNIFPDTLKNMVLSVSRFTQTPVDLAAICLIGVLSTDLQKIFMLNQSLAGKNL